MQQDYSILIANSFRRACKSILFEIYLSLLIKGKFSRQFQSLSLKIIVDKLYFAVLSLAFSLQSVAVLDKILCVQEQI